MLVAAIAYEELSDIERDQVVAVLEKHPPVPGGCPSSKRRVSLLRTAARDCS